MKAYVLTTGTIFILILVMHAVRVATEGVGLLREPVFVISSLLCVGLVAWSCKAYTELISDNADQTGQPTKKNLSDLEDL